MRCADGCDGVYNRYCAPHQGDIKATACGDTCRIIPCSSSQAGALMLTLTLWFVAGLHSSAQKPITISGRRVVDDDVHQPGDRFDQEEHVEGIPPRSGPMSVTARVRGINPGQWTVTVS